MNFKSSIMVIFLVTIIGKCSTNAVLTLIHDLVQNNIAGVPTVHQHTEWDFDPKEGKARRTRYESLNGRYGQELIDRLGMGMGFKGPWGSKVSSQEKPAVRYV